MDNERRMIEEQIFRYYIQSDKAFAFGGIGTSNPYLRIAAQTNGNKVFVLRMDLNGYPERKPNVYVECMLKDRHGRNMDKPNPTNHTLTAHPNGWTQICHYNHVAWRPDLSLWLVYLKCVIWLNIYEQSLHSGHDIDYYLKHQGENDVY